MSLSVTTKFFPCIQMLPFVDRILDPTCSKIKKVALIFFSTLLIFPLVAAIATLVLDGVYQLYIHLFPNLTLSPNAPTTSSSPEKLHQPKLTQQAEQVLIQQSGQLNRLNQAAQCVLPVNSSNRAVANRQQALRLYQTRLNQMIYLLRNELNIHRSLFTLQWGRQPIQSVHLTGAQIAMLAEQFQDQLPTLAKLPLDLLAKHQIHLAIEGHQLRIPLAEVQHLQTQVTQVLQRSALRDESRSLTAPQTALIASATDSLVKPAENLSAVLSPAPQDAASCSSSATSAFNTSSAELPSKTISQPKATAKSWATNYLLSWLSYPPRTNASHAASAEPIDRLAIQSLQALNKDQFLAHIEHMRAHKEKRQVHTSNVGELLLSSYVKQNSVRLDRLAHQIKRDLPVMGIAINGQRVTDFFRFCQYFGLDCAYFEESKPIEQFSLEDKKRLYFISLLQQGIAAEGMRDTAMYLSGNAADFFVTPPVARGELDTYILATYDPKSAIQRVEVKQKMVLCSLNKEINYPIEIVTHIDEAFNAVTSWGFV